MQPENTPHQTINFNNPNIQKTARISKVFVWFSLHGYHFLLPGPQMSEGVIANWLFSLWKAKEEEEKEAQGANS